MGRGDGDLRSDLKYLRWGSTQIAGHEFAGVLEDGTAVAVEGFFGCGECAQCEQGTYNMCTAGPPTAPGMLSPGGCGAVCDQLHIQPATRQPAPY